ncbi:MAG: hypothetical protein B9S32_17230 [Verrucomicrobia bacterium Tous-C9LFEB]|nr:MAG: hypothetical protein B9S32_17230 [Verrucomicrobia bacterium Tous-C9LFEB]
MARDGRGQQSPTTILKKILFFGDSITWGQGLAHSEKERWSARLSSRSGFVEVNEGKPGRPASALDEFDVALDRHHLDQDIHWLFLALGANDARDTGMDCVENTVAHIASLIARTQKKAPQWKIVLCSPYNIAKSHLERQEIAESRERNLLAMRAAYRALAEREGVGFIDFYGSIPSDSLRADGVHPNAEGHLAISGVAAERFLGLLEK